MGIYDRDYYRREGPSFLGSYFDTGEVCKWLIGLNVIGLVAQFLTRTPDGNSLVEEAFALSVPDVLHGQVWRLLTHAFLHSTLSVWHILWNMIILWWFGSDVEGLYGPREFLAFYLSAAVVGGMAYMAATLSGVYALATPALGASGAVTAVFVLCALHFPTRVVLVFYILPVPIWLLAVVMVAKDAFEVLNHVDNGVAAAAHVGGAAFAFCYYNQQWRLMKIWPEMRGWSRRLSRPALRVYREEEQVRPRVAVVASSPPPPASHQTPVHAADDEQLDAQMDAVLAKISRKEELTPGDREILRLASEKFKRRRS